MAKRVIILGGGVSGLSAGWRLSENGVGVDILEKSSSVGGLAASLREDNYCMDIGPHSFFSHDQEILNMVIGLFGDEMKPILRKVKFYYRGKFVDYPLTVQNVFFHIGLSFSVRAAGSFIKGKLMPRRRHAANPEKETVEDWAIESFGKHLYYNFFKPYTEQFWKVPCTELSSTAIPTHTRMSFANTLRLILRRKVSGKGVSLIEREMLPSFYPDKCFGEIAEKIAAKVRDNHGQIHLNSEAAGINILADGKVRVSYTQDGQRKELFADRLISTIPLPALIKMIEPSAPADVIASSDQLDYQSLIILGMVTRRQKILDSGYTYFLDRPYNRLFEMNEFSPRSSPDDENILGAEITCRQDDAIWGATKEDIFDMCIGSLSQDRYLGPGDVKRLFLIKAPNAYPIYRKDYAGHLIRLMDHVRRYDSITTLGRCGEFLYMDIDHCIKKAFDCASNLIKPYRNGRNTA